MRNNDQNECSEFKCSEFMNNLKDSISQGVNQMEKNALAILNDIEVKMNNGIVPTVMTHTLESKMAYAYTVGLSQLSENDFEIAAVGFGPKDMNMITSTLIDYLKHHKVQTQDTPTYVEKIFNCPVAFVPARDSLYMNGTFAIAKRLLDVNSTGKKVMIAVLPDENWKFPWQENVQKHWKDYQSEFIDINEISDK